MVDYSSMSDKELLDLKFQLETDTITLDNQQMAIKILMNSLYGALGNKYFRYFKLQTAEAITLYGQLASRWADKAVNEYLNNLMGTDKDYVVYGDTDSIYVSFEDLVKKFKLDKLDQDKITDALSKIAKDKIEPAIAKAYEELSVYMNAFQNKLEMEREVISPSAVFSAKKRYFMKVLDSEGVRFKEPKIKIVGIEAVKSSTPEACRDALKSIFKVILESTEEETREFIDGFKEKFKSLPVEQVSFPRGVNDIEKWATKNGTIKKGTPINVRASILFNRKLEEFGLKHVQPIQSGDKIKYTYMKMPNPVKQNIFSFPDFLPKEFKFEKYVDYDTQFEKTFLAVVLPILESIGWNYKKIGTLEDFL